MNEKKDNQNRFTHLAEIADSEIIRMKKGRRCLVISFIVGILLLICAGLLFGVVKRIGNIGHVKKHRQLKTQLAELKTSSEVIVKELNSAKKEQEQVQDISEIHPEISFKISSLGRELSYIEMRLRFKTNQMFIKILRYLAYASCVFGIFLMLFASTKSSLERTRCTKFLMKVITELMEGNLIKS